MTFAAEGRTKLKIKRIKISGTDLLAFTGTQPFFKYLRILGHEIAAAITASAGFTNGESVKEKPL